MFLGVTAWPAAVAAVLRARKSPSPLLWGAGAGGLVGLASLGGAHYPTLFALWLLGLVAWASVSGGRWVTAWVLLAGLAVVTPGPAGLRWLFSGLGLLVLLGGLATSRQREAFWMVPGIGLGLVGVAGWRLIPGFGLGQLVGRVRLSDVARVHERVPLSDLFAFDGSVDRWLHLGSPAIGVGLLLGLAVSMRMRHLRPIAVAVLSLYLVSCSVGRPASLWPLLHLGPGMSGANYPLRLQWVLLVLGPTAVSALLWAVAARLRWREEFGLMLALGLSCVLLAQSTLEERTGGERTPNPVGDGIVTGYWLDRDTAPLMALAWSDGQIRAGLATAMGFSPPGEPPPLDGLEIERGTVRVTGSSGDARVVPQRHLPGWSCVGADLPAPDPHAFLKVTLQEPTAECRYRTPGVAAGLALQALALVCIGLAWRRRTRA